jgi:hypothetical protein
MSAMQGFERMDRQLTDVAALAGHLVPAASMFAFLAEHWAEVFPDADYADLFAPPRFGRPSVPATQIAAVMTLQALHDYSDRETAETVRFDVRWKAATGRNRQRWTNRVEGRPERLRHHLRRPPQRGTQVTTEEEVTPFTWLCRTFGGSRLY